MQHRQHIFAGMFIALLVAVSVHATDEWSRLSVPDYAIEAQETTFLDGSAHQLYFVVEKPYPFNGVRDYYVSRLPATWVLCSSDAHGWGSFVDGTTEPPAWVQQRLVHWVDYENDRLLMLLLRYDTPLPPDGSLPIGSTSSRQLVVLAEYKNGTAFATESLKLKCDPAEPGV